VYSWYQALVRGLCPRGYGDEEVIDLHEIRFQRGTDDEDRLGVDFWLGGIPWSTREYDNTSTAFGVVTIGKSHKNPWRAEADLILSGENIAKMYCFRFIDCHILVSMDDIKNWLEEDGYRPYNINNSTGSSFYIIPIKDLKNFKVDR